MHSNPQPDCRIDPGRLHLLLADQAVRFDIDALSQCVSTNVLLAERARQGAASGTVIVTDRQTGGIGRRGRQWISTQDDPEASLTFSLLWRFASSDSLSGLSLAVGVGVARAFDRLNIGSGRIGLKWPNDILIDRQTSAGWGKVGGILIGIESVAGKNTGALAVIGIGINLIFAPGSGGAETGTVDAAALYETPDRSSGRERLLAQILIELAAVLDTFAGQGFAPFVEEWNRRHVWCNRPGIVSDEGGRPCFVGIIGEADTDGCLLVDVEGRTERVHSGDVSLRLA